MNFWQMRSERYSKGLDDLIEYMNTQVDTRQLNMIEIGSYLGESTVIFARNFKTVFSIDPYVNGYDDKDVASYHMPMEQVHEQFLKNTSDHKNIVQVRKMSDIAVLDFELDSIDFVYIDGNHQYEFVKKDIQNYLPIVKNNGFIAGHDYKYNAIKKAVSETVGEIDRSFCDHSWIKRKI